MLDRITRRVLGLSRRGRLGVLALGALACASTAVDTAETGGTLRDVQVAREGDATLVTLVGVGEPVYTAYLQQDPKRLTVDLASVQPAEVRDPVSVYDGLVEQVSVTPFSQGTGEGTTRVDVTLAAEAEYEVSAANDGLVIRVEPLTREASEATASGDETAASAEMMGTMGSMGAMPAATRLLAVETAKVDGGVVLHLRADGAIESAGSFTLEDPDRLVIDLPGLANETRTAKVALDAPLAQQVRIGQHENMVRVVVDGGSASQGFEGRRVMPTADGLVVALGEGAALEAATDEMVAAAGPIQDTPMEAAADAAAEQAAAKVAPATDDEDAAKPAELASVQGVNFDAQADRDRIVVVADRPVEWVLHQPDADTVVVSLPNAKLAPELDPRIAPKPGGPVSLVTAFEQPEMDVPEVRVVVERAEGLEPQITRQGALVMIDFPRSGAAAATPPVLAAASAADATQPAAISPAGEPMAAPAMAAPGAAAGVQAVPASLEPPAAISLLQEGGLSEGKSYTGRRISLDFKDIEMADVLRLIADVSDLNVIAGDEVKGKVTIRLVDVPWDQALDVILLTKGLGFVRVGNVLRIAPADLLKKEEEARLQERRALEQLEDLVVKLQPVNYAAVTDVKDMVRQLLTPRGTVQTDKRTNTLIIKDIPSVVDEATALVKAVDTQTPQVLIESKIVEASLDFSREFGAVWGIGAQPFADPFDEGAGFNKQGNDFFTLNPNSDLGNNAQFLNPITAGPTALFNLAGYVLDEKLNLNLQLQAAEVNGDGKVISSPRLVTLDNNKATIEQGVSIPFQTFENGDAQLEFVDAVLKLDVTPHITADRSIIMKIVVSRNAPDDSVFTLTGSPAIAKNQVNTETLVKDGQTLVIGGIYVVDKGKRKSAVPYLNKIPLIGAAFRSNEISDSRKELLIFVTPRVVMQAQEAS
jgi:type IV pilus assembly protein PilQ